MAMLSDANGRVDIAEEKFVLGAPSFRRKCLQPSAHSRSQFHSCRMKIVLSYLAFFRITDPCMQLQRDCPAKASSPIAFWMFFQIKVSNVPEYQSLGVETGSFIRKYFLQCQDRVDPSDLLVFVPSLIIEISYRDRVKMAALSLKLMYQPLLGKLSEAFAAQCEVLDIVEVYFGNNREVDLDWKT